MAATIDRHEVLFGLLIGAEYSRHRYLAKAPRTDFSARIGALTCRYSVILETPAGSSRSTRGAYGAADALAQPAAVASGSKNRTYLGAQAEGYNHVAGIT